MNKKLRSIIENIISKFIYLNGNLMMIALFIVLAYLLFHAIFMLPYLYKIFRGWGYLGNIIIYCIGIAVWAVNSDCCGNCGENYLQQM